MKTTMTTKQYLGIGRKALREFGLCTRHLEMNSGRIAPTANSVAKVSEMTGVPALELFKELKAITSQRMDEELAILKARETK